MLIVILLIFVDIAVAITFDDFHGDVVDTGVHGVVFSPRFDDHDVIVRDYKSINYYKFNLLEYLCC